MNQLTKDIAKWLKISIEDTIKVQNEMSIYWGIDFSEATLKELKLVAKLAYSEMKLNADI